MHIFACNNNIPVKPVTLIYPLIYFTLPDIWPKVQALTGYGLDVRGRDLILVFVVCVTSK